MAKSDFVEVSCVLQFLLSLIELQIPNLIMIFIVIVDKSNIKKLHIYIYAYIYTAYSNLIAFYYVIFVMNNMHC